MKKYEFANVELNEETMQKMIAQLVIENADIKRKIDKAIEYIENNSYIAPIEEIPLFTMNSNPQDLLNILKGNKEDDDIKCEICGISNETIQYREDPFVKELDNISQYKYMCDKCYENCLYDI